MPSRTLRIAALVLLALLAVAGGRTVYRNDSQDIGLRSLPLDPAHPGPRRLGDLIFLNAWELYSDNENFGGISALVALPQNRFVGVSDSGTLIGFGLTADDAIDRPFIATLPGADDEASYKEKDSESLAYDPATGRAWIGYEQNHAIRRFSPSFARIEAKVRPRQMQAWPENGGAEAMVRLPDGRFIVLPESLQEGTDMRIGLLFSGDPTEKGTRVEEFRYRPPAGYKPTDAAALPDGRLLVLHRKIALPTALFTVKLTLVDPPKSRPRTVVSGRTIATFAAPLLIDNMEGLAITQENGATIVWMISDDNFNILQRTLLMKFRLSERPDKKKPEAVAAPGFETL